MIAVVRCAQTSLNQIVLWRVPFLHSTFFTSFPMISFFHMIIILKGLYKIPAEQRNLKSTPVIILRIKAARLSVSQRSQFNPDIFYIKVCF